MVAKLPILPHMADNGPKWYFSRKEIEENSPSRKDGIDLKNEARLRKSYCTILQDLGMQLKVPQQTIATAIVFCHRFFIYQSHAKNDAKTIAAVCMFLAGKAEESPRLLKDVIFVSYGIIHKRNPAALQRFKQKDTFKEVYDQQKELFLLGEWVVLTTLGFDLNALNPYIPLINAIRKFDVAQNALVQVAWDFVNDGLRTSLCLQFKPYQLAAGAIFLAARFLKVKLLTEGERVWWQEFDVTHRQLEDISNQMLELYEQNSTRKSSHANEGGARGRTNHLTATTSTISENSIAEITTRDVGVISVQSHGSADTKSWVWDHNTDIEGKDCLVNEAELVSCRSANTADSLSCSNSSIEQPVGGAVIYDQGKTREGWCEPLNRQRPENQCSGQPGTKDLENAEEMESSCIDGHEFPSLETCVVSLGGQREGKRLHDFPHPTWGSTGAGRLDHPERDHKRYRTESNILLSDNEAERKAQAGGRDHPRHH